MERFAVCTLSFIPVRKEPDSRSEMLTQIIFGEYFEILESGRKWHNVRMIEDNCSGWISALSFTEVELNEIEIFQKSEKFYCRDLFARISNKDFTETIGWGCCLPFRNRNKFSIAGKSYGFTGNIVKADKNYSVEFIKKQAFTLLRTPYIWGGRTSFGIDCSGFVQVLFRFWDINLPRNSNMQFEAGENVEFNKIREGDLVFFMNDSGNVSHVGMYISNGQIIHSSGEVRIDKLDEKGIFNTTINDYTHKLKGVKRVVLN